MPNNIIKPSEVVIPNQANHSLAFKLLKDWRVGVTAINRCGNCNNEAAALIAGRYPRCQPCANHFINLWNQMRLNLVEED